MIAKDIIAIATSIIISVGGSGVIICALANFISERIAKRIEWKYQQRFEQEFEKVISKTNNPEKLFYFISPFLLPKKLKSFNPMKSLESQKINQDKKEEEQVIIICI